MLSILARCAAVGAVVLATASCAVHDSETAPLGGPSALALTLRVAAVPSSISFGINSVATGEESAITVTAIGPDGRPIPNLPIRMNIVVDGNPQDYGTLRERNIVTRNDGTASTTYIAPPIPSSGIISNNCGGSTLGTCVSIVATPASNNFTAVNPESVQVRLVPAGVILPPTQAPVASFVFQPANPSANAPVQFDASASCGSPLSAGACPGTHSVTSYSWNFGDGSTGSGQTVAHSFPLQQSYTVTLTVTNDLGASGSRSQVVSVGSGSLPTASFTISPQAPAVGEQVFFNGLASTPGQGHTIASYRWTFGDGGTASGATVSHAYATAGTYGVQLTVTDESGQSTTSSAQTITVGSPPSPTASFFFSPAQPAVGDTVVFDWRTTTTAQGQRIVSLDWNFGDSTPIIHCPGNVACTADGITTHVFNITGNFTVVLVVTDSAGRTNAVQKPVQVASGNPIPTCTASPASVSVGGTVNFSARNTQVFSGATVSSYSWNFGDSTSSTVGPDVSHVYGPPTGSKTVTISVVDSLGRQGSGTCQVTVVP